MKLLLKKIKLFAKGIADRKLLLYAASGTYYIFVSIVPLLMLMVSLVQFLPISQDYVISELQMILPQDVMTVMEQVISGIYENGRTAMAVSIILAVIMASLAMRAIMRGLDMAYSGKKQPYVLFFLRSLFYMVVFILMLAVSFLLLALGDKIMKWLQLLFPDITWLAGLFNILRSARYVVVVPLLFFVFLLMYRFVPVHKVKLWKQWPGALLVSVGWCLFSMIFSAFMDYSDQYGAYGAIGSVLVAMIWLYYSIFLVLVGGWLNHFLAISEKADAETKLSKDEKTERIEK